MALATTALLAASAAYAADGDDILNDLDTAPKTEKAAPPADNTSADSPVEEIKAAPAGEQKAEGPTQEQLQSAPASLDRIKAVPRKTLLKRGRLELAPFISLSMNDAFYQHLAVSGSVIYYLHDAFGIGVGADYLYAHIKSDNVDNVRENLTSVPGQFVPPNILAHLDAYWVPIYGKVSLFDSQIIHFDLYTVAGMGFAFAGEQRPLAANVGIGQRFVLSDWFALRFEVRDHLFLDRQEVNGATRSDIQSYVMFLGGVSIFVPPSFEYSY